MVVDQETIAKCVAQKDVDQEILVKIVEQIAVDQQIFDPMTASHMQYLSRYPFN